MPSGDGSNVIRALAVFLQTSSLARMPLPTDSAFSLSTRACIGHPSRAWLLRRSEIPSPEQFWLACDGGQHSGVWEPSHAAGSSGPFSFAAETKILTNYFQ
jgi:hypothetical protein